MAGAIVGLLSIAAGPAQAISGFQAGASSVDITPPAYTSESDAAFVPACGSSTAQIAQLWPGPRKFAFEKPYVDSYGVAATRRATPTATPITPVATRRPT